MSAAIELSGVTKRYGPTLALDALALQVRRGEMFGLIGSDGAGKTTAIRLMCGLLRADSGDVRVLGHDPVREHRRVTERVGYLSQHFSLYGDLSIDENVAFFAEIHGVRQYERRRDQLLDLTQLTPFRDRLADRLSGGMKQKLALACTLVHEPELILLDEPTTGVDPVSRREFWKLLSEFLSDGITIVMSTPYLDEAERCGRVALLHDGATAGLRRAVDPARCDARLFVPGRCVHRQPYREGLHVMTRPLCVLCGLLLFLPGVAAAQEAATLRISLEDAQRRAVVASHRLAEVRAREVTADAAVSVRQIADRPIVTFGAGYTRTNHVTEFVLPSSTGAPRVLYPDAPSNYRTRLDLQWPIYSGGRDGRAGARGAGRGVGGGGRRRRGAVGPSAGGRARVLGAGDSARHPPQYSIKASRARRRT